MNSFKIFQIEKNNEDIRRTILTNIVKMLTERKLINEENTDQNIKKLLSTQSDDYSYGINVDKYTDNLDKFFAIKIIHQKITAISKQSGISDFLYKYKDNPKIVIVKNISTKANQYVLNNFTKTEIFLEHELLINLVDHEYVPKYETLDKNSDDYIKYNEIFHCKKRNIPKLLLTDPVARYYNLKKHDIVRVLRPSETAGYSSLYRIVI